MIAVNADFQPKLGHILPEPSRPKIMLPADLALAPGAIVYPVSDDDLTPELPFDWLGNNAIGDCVIVANANLQRVQLKRFANLNIRPTAAQVVGFYWQYINPDGVDRGADSQTALEQIKAHGLAGRAPLMFAKVRKDWDLIHQVISLFGAVYFACNLQDPAHRYKAVMGVWRNADPQPVYGSHAVLMGAYVTSPEPLIGFANWAQVVELDRTFFDHNILDDFWLPIYPETLAALDRGSQERLAAAYLATTGSVLPLPPAPVPVPDPTPTPYQPRSTVNFTAIAPARLYDTRTGAGGGRLVGKTPRRFQIAGLGGVPSSAKAVALSVVALGPQVSLAWLNLSPDPATPVNLSTINAYGYATNGYPVLGLDATGGITAYSDWAMDLIIQVTGYFV